MPTYLTPGVYVEEVPSQSKPIEGVGTSVAAFVGLAPGGPVNTPMRIANWTQFSKLYGDPAQPENGPVHGGRLPRPRRLRLLPERRRRLLGRARRRRREGRRASARRRCRPPPTSRSRRSAPWRKDGVDGDVEVELVAEKPAAKAEGEDGAADERRYKLVVTAGGQREEHDGLTLKKGRTYIATKVNAASTLIQIEETGACSRGAGARHVHAAGARGSAAASRRRDDFAGDVAKREGIGGLAAVDEITMVCVPDLMTLVNGDDTRLRDLQGKIIAHCEMAGDRMAILDAPPDLMPQDILEWRMKTAGYDSKYATLYWPWLEVMDPLTNRPHDGAAVRPRGRRLGAHRRTRGVHKAPANEVVMGANGLAFQITHDEQGALNQSGINCIRSFPGRGIRIWGARTLSSDPEWRYLNVRRLFNYVSESIIEGTQWAVFEPNDERLWIRLRIAVGSFLTRTWRDGALFGATPRRPSTSSATPRRTRRTSSRPARSWSRSASRRSSRRSS